MTHPKFPYAIPPRKLPHKDYAPNADFCRYCGTTGINAMLYGDKGCIAVRTMDMPEIHR